MSRQRRPAGSYDHSEGVSLKKRTNIANYLKDIYLALGDLEQSIFFYDAYLKLSDSLLNEENIRRIEALEQQLGLTGKADIEGPTREGRAHASG